MTVPLRAPQTEALISYLHAVTQILIGYGEAPEGVGWQGAPGVSEFQGYGVVHPIPGGDLDGDLARPSSDGDLIWQVNAINATQAAADTVADRFAAALLGPLPAGLHVAGRGVMWVRADVPHGAARRDTDQPSLWWSHGRYRIGTTPLT